MADVSKKVLIIKLGYSETLDSMLSPTTSFGDVLRSTFILHYFKDDDVTWLVDEKARPLLSSNRFIHTIVNYNPQSLKRLSQEKFDVVINFEKMPDVCRIAQSLQTKEYLGFRQNSNGIAVHSNEEAANRLIVLSRDIEKKRKNRDCWQKILAEAIGKTWSNQPYVLGYRPVSTIQWDIGFNWTTSAKWENKSWPRACWDELEALLKAKYSISWQQGLNSLQEYIEWINSCNLIITSDSLGLHISFALRKHVIALFGPTSPYEMYFYDCGEFIIPRVPYGCVPCMKPRCDKAKMCMEYIDPKHILERVENAFRKDLCSPTV